MRFQMNPVMGLYSSNPKDGHVNIKICNLLPIRLPGHWSIPPRTQQLCGAKIHNEMQTTTEWLAEYLNEGHALGRLPGPEPKDGSVVGHGHVAGVFGSSWPKFG